MSQRPLVVVPDFLTEAGLERRVLDPLADIRLLQTNDEAEIIRRTPDAEVLIIFHEIRLSERTLGQFGCGRIGTAIALRAKALGLRVAFYDPYRPGGIDKALGIERCFELNELLARSEFLSLHCPLTRETYHILNTATLARLPRG